MLSINVKLAPSSHPRIYNRSAPCPLPCHFSVQFQTADAELYIARGDECVREALNTHSSSPFRILGSHESSDYHHLLRVEFLNFHFDGSATLDRRSDVPWLLAGNFDTYKEMEPNTSAISAPLFIARNCNPQSDSSLYVAAISRTMHVASPSNCRNNMEWPECGSQPCTKQQVLRRYKIYLAFENSDNPAYVSEKIYSAYEAGVLPVYAGAREVADTVPRGSYIDVASFDTPDDLAAYLERVLSNETLYESYFEWKRKPFEESFERRNKAMCRICKYVDTLMSGLEWDHERQMARQPLDTTPTQIVCGKFVDFPVLLLICLFVFVFVCWSKRSRKWLCKCVSSLLICQILFGTKNK